MNPLTGWLLALLLVAVAGLGAGYHFGGRSARRAVEEEKDEASESTLYYRGLNFLLADRPDQAIEEFTKVVRINSETVEIYLSLGNLFRGRGEVGRAIRIHQTIMARPNLPPAIRTAALFALADDYRQGGFVGRAMDAYQQVLAVDPHYQKALEGLLIMQENDGRWEEALKTLKTLEKVTGKSDPSREAHLRLGVGRDLLKAGDGEGAVGRFQEALDVSPGCVEGYRLLGEELLLQDKAPVAIKNFRKLKKHRPSHFFLVADLVQRAYQKLNNEAGFETCMTEAADSASASPGLLTYWSRWLAERERLEEAVDVLHGGLVKHPGHPELTRLLMGYLSRLDQWGDAEEAAESCLDHMTSRQKAFQCGKCGFTSRDIYWRCPQCHGWDTLEPM